MHLRDGIQTHTTVRQRYVHLVETGAITDDPVQYPVVEALDRLVDEISERRLARKSSALGWLFARKPRPRTQIRGLYVHGPVGCGKTMLMDLFFETVPARRKRRVHFNAFMAEVHDRIQKHRIDRKNGQTKEDDPIPPVARAIADDAWILCFDEFSVTDIADAMVLSRLFAALFANGVVLVATSNVAPGDLYRDGLNRQLFTPFIDLLKQHADIVAVHADKDYRLRKPDSMPVYVTPLSSAADRQMDEAWAMVRAGREARAEELIVKGRRLAVPRAAGRAARFDFAELCRRPLAARDYLALVARYDTLFVDHVPVLDDSMRNEAKRFILLIDTLYDRHCRLVVSAAAPPDRLHTGKRGPEAMEFLRTASRLAEMQGSEWLTAWADSHAAASAEPSPPDPQAGALDPVGQETPEPRGARRETRAASAARP